MGLFVPAMAFPLRILVKLMLFALLPISLIFLNVITRYEISQFRLFMQNQMRLRLLAH